MKKTVRLAQTVLASSIFASSIVYADTVLMAQYDEPVPNPQLTTTINGNIEITATGLVNATGIPGIKIDSAGAVITIDPSTGGLTQAIVSVGNNAIEIENGAGKNTGATINIGLGRTIISSVSGDAILVNDSAATINNEQFILGANSAIQIGPGGVNTTILNTGIGAFLQGGFGAGNSPSVFTEGGVTNGGTGLTLTNTAGGIINAVNFSDAVQLNQNFTSVTNNANSIIKAANGSAISLAPVAGGTITGAISNYGTITTTGSGQVIAIWKPFGGTITNYSGGVIEAAGNGGNVIYAGSSFNSITNMAGGIIRATASDFGINVTGNSPGTITNSGTIQTNATSLLYNNNTSSTGFINNSTGILTTSSGGNPAIEGRSNTTVNGIVVNGIGYGIVNNGTICNGTMNPDGTCTGNGGNAIQLNGANTIIPLLQQGGTITGNVLLSGGGGTALTMTGGIINGNISSSGTNGSTLNFNGGTVNGTVNIGNGSPNTINIAGTTLQAVNGGTGLDTFNLSGGSFTALTGGAGDSVNVIGTITQTGTISNVPTINVQNNGIFTVNNAITGATAFNINAGGTMITNFNALNDPLATITVAANGSLMVNPGSTFTALNAVNDGSITLQPTGVLDLLGTYTQNAGGILAPTVSATSSGLLDVTGTATFNPGSTMNPSVNSGGAFILPGTQYVVVLAGGGVIGAPTLVQPQSALAFFEQDVNANDITLTLQMHPIAAVAQGDNAQSIGAALDPLLFGGTTNPELLAVLGQLQLMQDSTYLTQALLQLAPSLNNAMIATSRISMDNAFDSVLIRLEELHGLSALAQDEEYKEIKNYELYNGVSYGDVNVVEFGANHFRSWVKVFGTIIDQHKLDEVEGFLADSAGIAIGGDWRLTNQALVGLALSGNKVETTDNTTAENKIETWSYQATLYGWFEPIDSLYFDTMLAVASHQYDTLRNIQVGSFAANATAKFLGTQYGAQTDIGYAFLSPDNWYVSPYLRFRYTYLDIGKYSETGAGGINLSVRNSPIEETIGGIGIRIAAKRDYIQAVYIPEVSATLLYDFAGEGQQLQSSFLGGGGFFYVSSNKPQQLIQIYSLGVSAYTNDNYSATLKFNFEHREQLFAYNGYLQISYRWD